MNTKPPVGLLALSRLLNLPADWLKQEADARRIPCLRIGRARLFDPDAVREALKRRAAVGEEVERG